MSVGSISLCLQLALCLVFVLLVWGGASAGDVEQKHSMWLQPPAEQICRAEYGSPGKSVAATLRGCRLKGCPL